MTEIIVIGAGPAGVAAAVTAAEAGARVTLIDENSLPGGQYFKQAALPAPASLPPTLAENFRQGQALLAGLSHKNITFRGNTLVWNVTPDRTVSLYGPAGPETLAAAQLIIAAGAYERVMPFPGWTLPGVMTVGGAQLLLKGQRLLAGQRILLAGTGPLLQVAGVQLLEAGAEIVAIAELQPLGSIIARSPRFLGHRDKVKLALNNARRLKRAGVPVKFGYAIVRATGENEVSGAVIARVDAAGHPRPGPESALAVDTVCLNFGFAPDTRLTQLAGCKHHFAERFGGWAAITDDNMETSQPGIFAVGEVRGIGGVEAALPEGRLAGQVAARKSGYRTDESAGPTRRAARRARALVGQLNTVFAVKPGLMTLAQDDTLICRCEEISAGQLRAAIREGITTLNNLKPWTRAGMGRCQGRICGPILAHLLAAETGLEAQSAGQFTVRPPVKPVPLSTLLPQNNNDEVAHDK